MLPRALGAGYLLLSLYYAVFFAQRQEPFTLVQMVILWCAAAWLLSGQKVPRVQRARWLKWLVTGAAVLVATAVFMVMDRDSHSVSDTLTRIVPTYALLAALVTMT